MNTKLLFIALLPLLILGGCTKETTETKSTTVNKPYVEPTHPFWGLWQVINSDPSDTSKSYYDLNSSTNYCAEMSTQDGFRRLEYSTVSGTDKVVRFAWNGFLPYQVNGDTMTVSGWNGPGSVQMKLLKIADGTIKPTDWMPNLNILRKVTIPYDGFNFNTNSSFGIDGDFLYVNHRYNGTYKFYKLNTLNGMYVDSVNAPTSTYHALHYKASSNKLYNTRYSGSQTMQQRTGLMGANSNLSTNSLNSVRAISTNASSGIVYAYGSNTIYSGSEGGNFSSLFTFSGTRPDAVVYYKGDQFLGEYNGSLVLFEISPTFKVIKQYRLPGIDGNYLRESIATNGSDIWVMARSNTNSTYSYYKVALP